MDDLYTQFLKRNDLDPVFFSQGPVLDEKKKMIIPEKLIGIKIAGYSVHLNTTVRNARLLLLELEMSRIQAKRDLQEWIKAFKGATIDPEDAERLINYIIEVVIGRLIWPLEYVTKEGQLTLEEFVPLATEMEAMLDEFYSLFDAFYDGMNGNEQALQARVARRKEELYAQTKQWADSAPLEVRATGHIEKGLFGNELHIHADVRSTLSEGRIKAQYMADDVVANLGINRERLKKHMELLQYLSDGMEAIIDGYVMRWKACIKNSQKKIRAILWPYIYATEKMVLSRPDRVECLNSLFGVLTDPKDFGSMKKYIDYYHFDFEKELGEKICLGLFNNYAKEAAWIISTDEEFYMYYYGKKTLIDCPYFYHHFKGYIERMTKRVMKISYEKYPDFYVSEKDKVVESLVKMIETCPDIQSNQKDALIEIVWYHYYDLIKDYKNRDKYDPSGKVKEQPVFQY